MKGHETHCEKYMLGFVGHSDLQRLPDERLNRMLGILWIEAQNKIEYQHAFLDLCLLAIEWDRTVSHQYLLHAHRIIARWFRQDRIKPFLEPRRKLELYRDQEVVKKALKIKKNHFN